MKIYVWENVKDWSSGLVIIAAENEGAAWKKLETEHDAAYLCLRGERARPVEYSAENLPTIVRWGGE